MDAVEGAVNYAHGLPEWAVTVTLLRDGEPVLTVVRQPEGDRTYTAIRGQGAYLNGQRLQHLGQVQEWMCGPQSTLITASPGSRAGRPGCLQASDASAQLRAVRS